MKKLTTLSILLISIAFVAPVQASAATSAGATPGSFFYFFDTTFENISLFFTFDSENKARKALEYADERLAEIEAIVDEENPHGVKTAIANYESNIALATEKSKEVKDKGQAESLLTSISDNTAKNQEVLAAVLVKVPEEAREAITRAIEASKKGQKEATKQITELKKEVSELKQELENLKSELKDKEEAPEASGDKQDEQTKAIDKLKNEIESLKKKVSEPKQQETKAEEKKEQPKSGIVNLPSGAVVEMDTNGNIIRTIKEAPTTYQAPSQPIPTTQTQNTTAIQISSVSVTAGISSARIEWSTSIPTESKLFLTDPDGTPHVYSSLSGLSTSHFVNMTLAEGLTFSYEIEAIAQGISAKKGGTFKMDKRVPTSIILKEGNSTFAYGGNCQQVFFKVGVKDQFGNNMSGESVSFFNPETNQFAARKTSESGEGIWATFVYYPQTFNQTKTMNFYIGDPPVSPSISVSLTFNIGQSIVEAFSADRFIQDSPTRWTEKTAGIRVNPTTGMCN